MTRGSIVNIGHLVADHIGSIVEIPDGADRIVGLLRGISHRYGGSTYVDLQPVDGDEPRNRFFHRGPFNSKLRIVVDAGDGPSQSAPVGPVPCPECRQGKHQNCDGFTWNLNTDSRVTCPCAAADHERIRTEKVDPQ